jgi:hypothetical protein
MFGDIRSGKGGNVRNGKGGNVRNGKTFFPQKLERQAKALERNKYRAALSNADQLKELDLRLGKGVGATKERARLSMPVKESCGEKTKTVQG